MKERPSASFLCPECGCRRFTRRIAYRPDPLPTAREVMHAPWRGVLEAMVCAGCGFHIPTCYGELWDGLTPGRALAEWRHYYRDGAKREWSALGGGGGQT